MTKMLRTCTANTPLSQPIPSISPRYSLFGSEKHSSPSTHFPQCASTHLQLYISSVPKKMLITTKFEFFMTADVNIQSLVIQRGLIFIFVFVLLYIRFIINILHRN